MRDSEPIYAPHHRQKFVGERNCCFCIQMRLLGAAEAWEMPRPLRNRLGLKIVRLVLLLSLPELRRVCRL